MCRTLKHTHSAALSTFYTIGKKKKIDNSFVYLQIITYQGQLVNLQIGFGKSNYAVLLFMHKAPFQCTKRCVLTAKWIQLH